MVKWFKYEVEETDGAAEWLWLYHTDHPNRENIVTDALSRKLSRSLTYILEVWRPLIKELYALVDEGVIFNINDAGAMIAHSQCCYPIFDPCFDKIFKKSKNNEKQQKSKKKIF